MSAYTCKISSEFGLDNNIILFWNQVRSRDRWCRQAKENWSCSKGGREPRTGVGQCRTDTTPRWTDAPVHNVIVVVVVIVKERILRSRIWVIGGAMVLYRSTSEKIAWK